MSEPIKGLRTRILYAIHKHGMQTTAELAELLGVERRTVTENVSKAKAEGYLTSRLDDVTGALAYSLTPRGVARVKNGSIGTGSVVENDARDAAHQSADADQDALKRRIAQLEADLAEAQSTVITLRALEEAENFPAPTGWLHIWEGGHAAFATEAEARRHIEDHAGDCAILAAQVATAKRCVVWG